MTATKIKALETRYGGCRFRSRLEARWAVFFDCLDIQWQYEPQGFVVDGDAYLPDFWLPEIGLWVEVKGALSHRDLKKIIKAVGDKGMSFKPEEDSGAPNREYAGSWGPRMLLLGQVPEPGQTWRHQLLTYIAGEILAIESFFLKDSERGWLPYPTGSLWAVGRLDGLSGNDEDVTRDARERLLEATPFPPMSSSVTVDSAYLSARTARFEHGESGKKTIVPITSTIQSLSTDTDDLDDRIAYGLTDFDLSTAEGRVRALKKVATGAARVIRTPANLDSHTEYIEAAARVIGLEANIVRTAIEVAL